MGQKRKAPKPMERRSIEIPSDLHRAMREVFAYLEMAERDPDEYPIDFDDAIQTEELYGGKFRDEPRPFQFTYFRTTEDKKEKWSLRFSALEIEDIADEHTPELMLYCCTTEGCGFKSTSPEDSCDCEREQRE